MQSVWVISYKQYDDYEAESVWSGSREDVASVLAGKASMTGRPQPDHVSPVPPSLDWSGDILYGTCVGTGVRGWKAEMFPVVRLPRLKGRLEADLLP